MVVGNLRIVNKTPAYLIAVLQQFSGVWLIYIYAYSLKPFLQSCYDILAQITRIGSRIGQQLVCFVQILHIVQCFLCTESKALIRIPLQLGKVIKLRRLFLLQLSLYLFDRELLLL